MLPEGDAPLEQEDGDEVGEEEDRPLQHLANRNACLTHLFLT